MMNRNVSTYCHFDVIINLCERNTSIFYILYLSNFFYFRLEHQFEFFLLFQPKKADFTVVTIDIFFIPQAKSRRGWIVPNQLRKMNSRWYLYKIVAQHILRVYDEK